MSTFGEPEATVTEAPPASPDGLVVTPAEASTGRRGGDEATVTLSPVKS